MTSLELGRRLLAANAVASGTTGVVACTSRTAASAGATVLERGGNAVDAALTAALVETVTMPSKCGLGGELVALHLAPGASRPTALLAIGQAPAGLADAVRENGLPATGPLSVAVPAAPAGYAEIAERSRFGLAAAARPAITLADRGIVWSPLCARLAAQADDVLTRWQPDGCVYRPVDGPLQVGQRLRLPGLSALLHIFSERGRYLFHGPVGRALVSRVQQAGGVLTNDDLQAADAHWTEPVAWSDPSGVLPTVFATPAPTFGAPLVEAVADIAAGVGTVEAVAHAMRTRPGDPAAAVAMGGTSAVAAVDAEGGAVVIVHSNSFPQFGSGLIVDDYDLVLSNRAGRGFSSDPAAPNAVRPGARPATTLHAWGMVAAGRPAMLGATSGGEHQIEWNAQVIAGLFAEPDRDLGELLLDERWESGPDGPRYEDFSGADGRAVTSSHVIVRVPDEQRPPLAAADPRLGGTAIGV